MISNSGIVKQSAVIPYRIEDDEIQFLLITSINSGRWVIPKGLVEPYLTPENSAAKEALEEAGIKGEIVSESLGSYSYCKWGGTYEVVVFILKVTSIMDQWDEMTLRQREWVTVDEAVNRVEESDLKSILQKVPMILSQQ